MVLTFLFHNLWFLNCEVKSWPLRLFFSEIRMAARKFLAAARTPSSRIGVQWIGPGKIDLSLFTISIRTSRIRCFETKRGFADPKIQRELLTSSHQVTLKILRQVFFNSYSIISVSQFISDQLMNQNIPSNCLHLINRFKFVCVRQTVRFWKTRS